MDGKYLELSVVRIMGIGEKDQLIAGTPTFFDHVTDCGNRRITTRRCQVARLAKTVEDIDHDRDVRHA